MKLLIVLTALVTAALVLGIKELWLIVIMLVVWWLLGRADRRKAA